MNKKVGWKETIEWYNKNAQYYAKRIQNLVNYEVLKKFVSKLKKANNYIPKVLDAGCAAGRDSKIFKDLGLEVVGLDISEGLLKIAKSKYPEITFIQGDFRNLPFEKESFDGIWCSASLLHFEKLSDVLKSLKEFYRVLRSKGVLYVSVKKKLGEKDSEVVIDSLSNAPRFFHWFTEGEVISLLKKVGFEKIEIFRAEDLAKRKEVKFISAFATKS